MYPFTISKCPSLSRWIDIHLEKNSLLVGLNHPCVLRQLNTAGENLTSGLLCFTFASWPRISSGHMMFPRSLITWSSLNLLNLSLRLLQMFPSFLQPPFFTPSLPLSWWPALLVTNWHHKCNMSKMERNTFQPVQFRGLCHHWGQNPGVSLIVSSLLTHQHVPLSKRNLEPVPFSLNLLPPTWI